VSTQTAEDPAVCLELRALAAGRRLACLNESMAGCPALDPKGQATLAQIRLTIEEISQLSTSCAVSLTALCEPERAGGWIFSNQTWFSSLAGRVDSRFFIAGILEAVSRRQMRPVNGL
jgi:hypothetical protein